MRIRSLNRSVLTACMALLFTWGNLFSPGRGR